MGEMHRACASLRITLLIVPKNHTLHAAIYFQSSADACLPGLRRAASLRVHVSRTISRIAMQGFRVSFAHHEQLFRSRTRVLRSTALACHPLPPPRPRARFLPHCRSLLPAFHVVRPVLPFGHLLRFARVATSSPLPPAPPASSPLPTSCPSPLLPSPSPTLAAFHAFVARSWVATRPDPRMSSPSPSPSPSRPLT